MSHIICAIQKNQIKCVFFKSLASLCNSFPNQHESLQNLSASKVMEHSAFSIQAGLHSTKSSLTLSSWSHHVHYNFSHSRLYYNWKCVYAYVFFLFYFLFYIDKALANQLAQDVQDIKARLMRKKKSEREGNRMSKCSLVKAASILNMTETDLVNMLDTDEVSIVGNKTYCIATE